MFPILTGIVGSTAYGLAGPDSDVDTLGIFAHPTEDFFGLKKLDETKSTTDPDITIHEAAKYCRLALQGNPTVMELMWLPSELYTHSTFYGQLLIGIREHFLSAPRVRNAYLGYATQQFRKLEARGGTFSSDLRNRTEKHARHLLRLLDQGTHLYLTGELRIRLYDPEKYKKFGKEVADGKVSLAKAMLNLAEQKFDEPSPLPDKPNVEPVEAWLEDVRRSYLDRPKRTE